MFVSVCARSKVWLQYSRIFARSGNGVDVSLKPLRVISKSISFRSM